MRTRREIEKDAETVGKRGRLMLEVLLDIRDLLAGQLKL